MPVYTLRVNGRSHRVEGDPEDSLLSVLRYDLGLIGSKFGCGEGHCGSCTVLVDGQTTRSCVMGIARVAGKAITTIEGLSDGDRLHPVQQAFIDVEAFQCGYCTPGMVMAVVGLLRTTANPSEQDIAKVLDRNVCRCGTFPRIVKAIQAAAAQMRSAPSNDLPPKGGGHKSLSDLPPTGGSHKSTSDLPPSGGGHKSLSDLPPTGGSHKSLSWLPPSGGRSTGGAR
jgi:nicotinate dehydrogenase subunit A